MVTFALPALAASLGALPTQIEADIPAGSERIVEVRVRSGYDDDLALVARVWELGQDATGYAFAPPGTLARSAAAWCAPEPVVPVPARGDAEVHVRVHVPTGAHGGYSAVLLLDAVYPDAPDLPLARLAVPLLVDTGGDGAIDIQAVEIEPPTTSTPLVVRTRAYNPGEAHLSARASAVILRADGTVVGRTMGSPELRVLPGMSAIFEDRWAVGLAPGSYRAVVWFAGQGDSRDVPFAVP